jgi:hypothetical protein
MNYRRLIKRICKKCHKEFEINKNSRRLYCENCGYEKREKKEQSKLRNVFNKSCINCKKIITVENKYVSFVFCNDKCKEQYYSKLVHINYPNKKKYVLDKQEIYRLFVVEEKTLYEISQIYEVPIKKLKKYLNKTRIKKKTCLKGYYKIKCLKCSHIFVSSTKDKFCKKCIKKEEERFIGKIENIDYVECKVCFEKRENLVTHVTRMHNLSVKQYQRKFKSEVVCENLRSRMSKKISSTLKREWETGKYDYLCWPVNRNNFEKELDDISCQIVYVGGQKQNYKRLWVRTSRLRNPDFVILDQDYCKKLTGEWFEIQDKVSKDFIDGKIKVTKVIEHNGLYWHKKRFNGRSLEQYERDTIKDYKSIGIKCLVVWDFQLENSKTKTYKRIKKFVSTLT